LQFAGLGWRKGALDGWAKLFSSLVHKVKRRIVRCEGQLALHEQVGKKRPSVEVSFNHFKLVVASFQKAGAHGIGYRVLSLCARAPTTKTATWNLNSRLLLNNLTFERKWILM
jgi:hypothetical protein